MMAARAKLKWTMITRAKLKLYHSLLPRPPIFQLDEKEGGCDGPIPKWRLLYVLGPKEETEGIGLIGHLVPWRGNPFQIIGQRWCFRLEDLTPRYQNCIGKAEGWGSVQLFDRFALVRQRGHVLHIKSNLVEALFMRIA